jgi:ankyrin repeat protein
VTFKSLLADFEYRMRGNVPQQDTEYHCSALLLPYYRIYGGPNYTSPYQDNPELVKAMLEHGANPYSIDEDGDTILFNACFCNHANSIRVLLEHHVNPNVKGKDGRTPLYSADNNCARLLIEYGADVNARDDTRSTPEMSAKTLATYQLLFDHNADLNARNNDGETDLILSARYNFQGRYNDIVRFMLQHGANVSIKDHTGKSALDYAKDSKEKDLISLLEAALKKEQAEHKSSTGTGRK